MTNFNLKKMSTLVGVSVFALFALSADPQISGSSYTIYSNAVSESSGTYSSDDSISTLTTVVLEDSTDNTDFTLDVDFAIDEAGAVTFTADEASVSYTSDMFSVQAGWSEMDMGYENWYNAGDVLDDSETWNASASFTVLSDDAATLALTPFIKLPTDTYAAGYGAAVNYDLTAEEGLTGVEAVAYVSEGDAQLAATITGSLGLDFAVDGKVQLSDASDFELGAVLSKTIDATSAYLDLYYTNSDSTLAVVPQVYYDIDDTTSIVAYYEGDYDFDASELSNWARLGVQKYLSDDFYVYPYLESELSSSQIVELNVKVYKSF
ncbi:MAG: hypothetical protein OWP43_03805 [Sphaerochaetaceae bacterium]|nr:hypothetical protein [Sphaerochaetaceae bacterium]MDC7244095.1 hypothetical protein [Sphaerochaetaceae bacterium]